MQQHHTSAAGNGGRAARAWKAYRLCEQRQLDAMHVTGAQVHCPRCGAWLVARRRTRRPAAEAARGSYDLDCRDCHRFHTVCCQGATYLPGLRRLAAAVLRA